MQNLIKIQTKKYPMIRKTFLLLFLLSSVLAYSQASSDSASFFLQKGRQEKLEGRKMQSMKSFEKALEFDAKNKIVISELAAISYDLRRYAQAIEHYKKLAELGDASPDVYKQLMILSNNFKRHDDVIFYAKKLKEADPSEKVNYYIGKVYYDQENYGEAIKYLNEAAKEEPTNAEVPYMIARSYADMQNYKQCIPYYLKAIEIDTAKYYWMYELGLMYYAINDSKNSLKYVKLAGDKGLKKDNSYMENLAIAYINVGQANEGIAILQDILKKKPSDISILNLLAETYYDNKQYQEAMDHWDQILGYDKTNASALYMIGMCYQKKGEKEKGMQLCDKAIEMDPSLRSLKTEKKLPGM